MKETRVSSRYAKALLNLASESGQLDAVRQDWQLILDTCSHSRDLVLLLNNPVIKADKKVHILEALFSTKITKLSMDFLRIITRKRRENYLPDIAEQFISIWKNQQGIQTAIITSAAGIDETLRSALIQMLRENSRSEIELVEKSNPDLIGGFVLRMGDMQYNASVLRSLNELRKEFHSNPFIRKN